MTYKDVMITTIRGIWAVEGLESMTEAEVKEIYEALLDWIE